MTQYSITNRIIEAMGLDVDHTTPTSTQYLRAPLTKGFDGDPYLEYFACPRYVILLLYLSGY